MISGQTFGRKERHVLSRISFTLILLLATFFGGCSSDSTSEEKAVPTIKLDNPSAIYTVKSDKMLTISPSYTNVKEANFLWTYQKEVLSTEPQLQFQKKEEGKYLIHLQVKNRWGEAKEELRIDVVAREIPIISFPEAEQGFEVAQGEELSLQPSIAKTSIETSYKWTIDGKEVSTDATLKFKQEKKGTYNLTFQTKNEDGEDKISFQVEVVAPEELPLEWTFEQTDYFLSQGRMIRLQALDVENSMDATFSWKVNGAEKQKGKSTFYIFEETIEGVYHVEVKMQNHIGSATKHLSVTVCPKEGTYRRAKTASSQAECNKVYTYLPAPGQFINEGKALTDQISANQFAEQRLATKTYLSLGGFGGMVVVGFDHSINNGGDYDFAIVGNSRKGSSEPGVVWVMQDENGDGKPNDTWYELKGSETGNSETIHDYAVTYYRPSSPRQPVAWKDNQGNRGEIDYLGAFHRQDFYYPTWVKTNQYTLRGTRLEARNYREENTEEESWVNPEYDWGYVDNFSPIDRLDKDPSVNPSANHFKISNAMTFDGQPANLKYIDFIKVQNAVNAKSGWIGELSTEVLQIYDFSMKRK